MKIEADEDLLAFFGITEAEYQSLCREWLKNEDATLLSALRGEKIIISNPSLFEFLCTKCKKETHYASQ